MLGTANAMAEDAAPAEAASAEAAPAEPADEAPAEAAAPSGGGRVNTAQAVAGLGSIFFGGGTGFTQIFAATTNGSSANRRSA